MEFTDTEKKIECLFSQGTGNEMDAELLRWFLFALTGRGKSIAQIKASEMPTFKERLNEIIDTVYLWHKEYSENQLRLAIKDLQQNGTDDKRSNK